MLKGALSTELYKANRGLLHKLARRYAAIDTAVDMEDLTQAGYLGLVEAERTFDPGRGASWVGWAALHVKRTMREAVGINTTRVRAHLGAVSLDAPLGAEEGAASFLDMLEDESIPDASSTLVEAERAATVRAAVDRLEGVKRDVVAVHDPEGLTYERVGAMHGMTAERARQIRVAALRDLRRDRQLRRLLDDETLYYQRRGVNTFNSTWTSSTEAAAMWRIQQREKFIKSGTGNRNQLGRGGADRPYRHGEPGDHSQAGQADGGIPGHIPLRAR